jgi:hypothetical protein
VQFKLGQFDLVLLCYDQNDIYVSIFPRSAVYSVPFTVCFCTWTSPAMLLR